MKIFKQTEIEELANIINSDGVLAIPTDTVYGLCAKMNSKKAREKLMDTKKRPNNKSLPIMCADEKQIKSIAIVNKREEKIIQAFMPGPITLVMQKSKNLPEFINQGSPEIGIRMATSEEIKLLINKVGGPICVTSANLSGEPVCESIEEIKNKFPDIDGIIEGQVSYGKASTIVDCTSEEIRIIREGPISLEEILSVIKK